VHVDAEEWRAQLARGVARRVRHYRLMRGLSVQRLADICTEDYGLPIKRTVLANFEAGRRPALSVAELLILARILRVPPILLLFPVGQEAEAEVLPRTSADTWSAAKWFTGESEEIPGHTEEPQDTEAIRLYREHDQVVEEWREVQRKIKAFLGAVGEELERAEPGPEVLNKERLWDAASTELRNSEEAIRGVRRSIRAHGLTPPTLPDEMARIEQKGDG
jgi:transcriptional regulator with XRE-family HTH domain